MTRFNLSLALLSMTFFGLAALPARAELAVGKKAPTFSAEAAQAGKVLSFSLADALGRGPVIVYFYPQGPSETCYVENYEFSFVAKRLQAQGITVLGVNSDSQEGVMRTSVLECSDKMILAADPSAKIINSYAAQNPKRLGFALNVGYVIAPNGRIAFAAVNNSANAVEHVADLVRAAEALAAGSTP